MKGIKVMLNELSDNADSVKAYTAALGKKIAALDLRDEQFLNFVFDDSSKLCLYDDGQSCCENRYMRTDDNLADYIGGTLDGAEIRNAPSVEDQYGEHEVQFLAVKTSKGQFTVSNHNEHNGYYGGFCIRASC